MYHVIYIYIYIQYVYVLVVQANRMHIGELNDQLNYGAAQYNTLILL